MDLAVNDTTLEIELAELLLDLDEEVVHEEDVHFLNVFHLDGVDAVDFGDETLRVAPQVVQVPRQRLLEHGLLARVHCLDQESPVEGREHEGATLSGRLLGFKQLFSIGIR